MRTFKQVECADLKSTNEVDYVCSWHKDAPKEDTALSAFKLQQQQPWWIQPALGLYDVKDSWQDMLTDTCCSKPANLPEVLTLFRSGLPEWLSLFRSGAAPNEDSEDQGTEDGEEGCELDELLQLLMRPNTPAKQQTDEATTLADEEEEELGDLLDMLGEPSPLALGAAAAAV